MTSPKSSSRRPTRPPPPTAGSQQFSREVAARPVNVAWTSKPRDGETMNGDSVVVREIGDSVLIALIDALGHGPKAALVAQTTATFFDTTTTLEGGVTTLVQGVHRTLQGSRGAATLMMVISPAGIEACSVGNVELRSSSGKLPFVLTPGVLGVRLRSPKVAQCPMMNRDRFVLFSDGISGRFDLKALAPLPPSDMVAHLFKANRHAHDDATSIVIDIG